MFELLHLRAFVAVATDLHFGRAAARLHITQPPLSRQIRALEDILGVTLFERTTRAVRLTSAGHRFLPEAVNLLRQAEIALEISRNSAAPEAGRIALGLIGASTYDVLPRLVRRVRERLPDVELALFEMNTPEQLEALALRRIDVGIGRLPRGARNVQTAVIFREPLVLALPADHALNKLDTLSLGDISDHPVVGYEANPASPLYELIEQMFLDNAVTPAIRQRCRQTQTILSLVEAGAGLAIVPDTARNACFRDIQFRPFRAASAVLLDTHCLWREDNLNPVLATFRSLMFETFWVATDARNSGIMASIR